MAHESTMDVQDEQFVSLIITLSCLFVYGDIYNTLYIVYCANYNVYVIIVFITIKYSQVNMSRLKSEVSISYQNSSRKILIAPLLATFRSGIGYL